MTLIGERVSEADPQVLTEVESAQQLRDRILTKQITLGVIGLGYVGLPLSVVFAEAGVRVLGFDIDKEKVAAVKEGRSYLKHLPNRVLEEVQRDKRLDTTLDFSRAAECDALIVCVPTPLDSHLEPDLRFIRETCEAIGPFLQPHVLVSLESTTWPGTTEEVMQPLLESLSGLKVGQDLYLAYSPEREDPGNPQFGTRQIPKLVGAANQRSLNLAVDLYRLGIDTVIPLSGTRIAESAKLFENIFRCVNIALVNELKIIFDKMGIDVWEVIEAAGTKPFGFMPFWPGPGLGGHCIPIDPYYLTWKAKEFGINTRFIELAGEINRSMPRWVVSKIQDCLNDESRALKGSRILVLGLAYKPDVSDLRESPSLELMKLLEEKGAVVEYHDPHIPELGRTREYGQLVGRKSRPLSRRYECFVLATNHSCFCPDEILSYGVPVVDTRHFFPDHPLVFPA